MSCTEEEAKTRWCPFARANLRVASEQVVFSGIRGAGEDNCIGSACMAWTWVDFFGPGSGKDDPTKEKAGYQGHCGLAGRP